MPSTTLRLTLVENTQQNHRIAVRIAVSQLLSSAYVLDEDEVLCSEILRLAKNKLRMKKPSRAFRARDGRELCAPTSNTNDNIQLENDDVLIISSGEELIGSSTSRPSQKHPILSPSHPLRSPNIHVIASKSHVEPVAITQLHTTAESLPSILSAIGMPDLHPGNRFPIGAVFLSSPDTIYPALIGGDIGCGMALYRTGTRSAHIKDVRALAEKIRGIEGKWVSEDDERDGVQSRLRAAGVLDEELIVDAEISESLGTIGGGNHFAEIQAVEEVRDAQLFHEYVVASSAPPSPERDETEYLFLLVHSGSRGLGQRILASTLDSHPLPSEPLTSPSTLGLASSTPFFTRYLAQHDDACRWARANRDLIAHRILSLVDSSYNPSDKPFCAHPDKVLDIWHNNVELKEIGGEGGDRGSAWVHRKGAAPSDKGLVVIPGSRGAVSYLVLPRGDQTRNGYSLAHGAGRLLTRTKARGNLSRRYPNSSSASRNLHTTSLGSHVVCDDRDLLYEEAPEAYKDVECVVEDLEDEGLITVVAVMRPVVTYKMRKD